MRPAHARRRRRQGPRVLLLRFLCISPTLPNCRSEGGRRVPYPLSFRFLHNYKLSDPGVSVPVSLSAGPRTVALFAKVDTGADYCLFEREYAEELSIEVENGRPLDFSTAGGRFRAFGHELTIGVLD